MKLDQHPRSSLLALGSVLLAAALAASCGLGGDAGSESGGAGGGSNGGDVSGAVASGSGVGGSVPGFGSQNAADQAASVTASATTGVGTAGGADEGGGAGAGGEFDGCDTLVEAYDVVTTMAVDDSNSFASPLLVRELIADSAWDASRPLPVRPHEFLNYYGEAFSESVLPSEGELSIRVDAMPLDFPEEGGAQLLELGVSVSPGAVEAPSPDVTFLVDTSATMAGEPTTRAIGALRGAAQELEPDQEIAVLSWARTDRVLRPMAPWKGEGVEDIVAAIQDQKPDTNFDAALGQALDISRAQAASSGRPGVVMVITDGKTAAGPETLERVSAERSADVPVRVVGVGVGPARAYSDEVLDELTDRSGGAYFYVPDQAAADAEIGDRFDELTRIAASDVGLELHLPSSVSIVALTGDQGQAGSGNSVQGQNLAAGGTMLFHVLLRVVDPADCQAIGVAVKWNDLSGAQQRYPVGVSSQPIEVASLFLRPGSPELQRVSALAKVTDALRGPTASRISSAADRLSAVLTGAGDPMAELCLALTRRCEAIEDDGSSCHGCDP